MLERIEIDKGAEDLWGYLVKTWATGDSYVPDPADPAAKIPAARLPIPRDLDELKAQLQLCGLGDGVTIPEHIKGLAVLQYSPDTLALRLPPRAMVKEGEERLAAPGAYPVREFIRTMFVDPTLRELDPGERLRLHACRIGDYSVTSCI